MLSCVVGGGKWEYSLMAPWLRTKAIEKSITIIRLDECTGLDKILIEIRTNIHGKQYELLGAFHASIVKQTVKC